MAASQVIAELLGRQHGVVAAWQAQCAGIPSSTFSDFLRSNCCEKLHRGVWAHPASADTLARRIIAARLVSDRGSVVTAATLFELLGVLQELRNPRPIHLLVAPDASPALRTGICWHRGRWVAGDEPEWHQDVPCAPVLRGLADESKRASVTRLERLVGGIDRLRLARPAQVAAYLSLCGRFPGKPKLVAALARVDEELVHSEDERYARGLLKAAGITPYKRPLAVQVGTVMLGEIDIPFPHVRYGVEVDGPRHLLPDVAAADRVRDARLKEQAGWHIERFDTDEIAAEPHRFVEAVRRSLRRLEQEGIRPWPLDSGETPPMLTCAGTSAEVDIAPALPRPERPVPPSAPAPGGEGAGTPG